MKLQDEMHKFTPITRSKEPILTWKWWNRSDGRVWCCQRFPESRLVKRMKRRQLEKCLQINHYLVVKKKIPKRNIKQESLFVPINDGSTKLSVMWKELSALQCFSFFQLIVLQPRTLLLWLTLAALISIAYSRSRQLILQWNRYKAFYLTGFEQSLALVYFNRIQLFISFSIEL